MPRFTKGDPAGPGRPAGRRNKLTELVEELSGDGTVKLLRVVRERAEKGDMRAASIVLARTWPRRRGGIVPLDLPPVETSAGLIQAQAALVAAMARGEVTPAEAASIASVLETQRRAIETHEHTRLIKELQEAPPAGESWERAP